VSPNDRGKAADSGPGPRRELTYPDRRGLRPSGGRGTPTSDELHAYCREHLAPYRTPATWVLTDAFPLTAPGKIRKSVLRDRSRRA
jgi:acyl-CoA synthetase (AMP-forming)/AMP-acid ligase II